jgi:hypothetical protein
VVVTLARNSFIVPSENVSIANPISSTIYTGAYSSKTCQYKRVNFSRDQCPCREFAEGVTGLMSTLSDGKDSLPCLSLFVKDNLDSIEALLRS